MNPVAQGDKIRFSAIEGSLGSGLRVHHPSLHQSMIVRRVRRREKPM
jgi:hypothetical protein